MTELTDEQFKDGLARLGYEEIPEPRIGIAEVKAPRTEVITSPITLPPRQEPVMVDKVRTVWAIIEKVVTELIEAAENLYGPKSGETKKAYVSSNVLRLLREIEGKYDYLPKPLEGILFKVLEWTLDNIIERVFRSLQAKGLVNASI